LINEATKEEHFYTLSEDKDMYKSVCTSYINGLCNVDSKPCNLCCGLVEIHIEFGE
jgi:hypothetical protein